MPKLPFRLLLKIYVLLATCLVVASITIAKISWLTTQSETFTQAQSRLLSSVSMVDFDSVTVESKLLEPLVAASPISVRTFVQILDQHGNVSASAGTIQEDSNAVDTGFVIPLVGDNEQYTKLRLRIDLGFISVVTALIGEIALYTLPAFLCFILYSFQLTRSHSPVVSSFQLTNKALQLVPHHASKRAKKPGIAENRHNLKLLIVSLHKHLTILREDSAMLNTSTKILAYQKTNSESILRSAPQGVLVLDETGQVSFVNQQFLRWYRLDDEQVMGKSPGDWCERHDMKAFLNRYRGSVARRAEIGAVEFDPPGKPNAYLSMTAYPMFSSRTEEHIKSTLVVFSDTTSEVQAEKAREDFAVAAAHELKTPLHAIGMHAEMLLTEDGEDKSLRVESANFINTEVAHIGELVRNMLSITRIEIGNLSINRKLTKLDDLLDTLLTSMQTNASEHNITLVKDYQQGMEPSFLDKDLLRVALNNLLSNAIKYNTPGGTVKVSVIEAEHSLTLTVSDTGLGISEGEKNRIFEKFFRSEDSRIREVPGHGLGLSLVKEIVELHGGTINVESTIDKGTDFIVRLKKINVPLKEAA